MTQSGAGYISFPTKESRDQAKETLEGTFSVESKNKNVENVYPKIRISGIDYSKYKDNCVALKETILMKNYAVNELVTNQTKLFEILFIKETDGGFGYAVVKVDPQIRSAIQSTGNKLFIDLTACHVSDRLHLVQCYQCQEFGHKKGSHHCKSKDVSVCMYCAENHQSKNCPNKKNKSHHKCSNCSKSTNSHTRSNAAGHTTTSDKCPVVQNEAQSLISRTMGLNIDAKNMALRNVIVM